MVTHDRPPVGNIHARSRRVQGTRVCSKARLPSSPSSRQALSMAYSSLWIQHEPTALNSHPRRVCSRVPPNGCQALA